MYRWKCHLSEKNCEKPVPVLRFFSLLTNRNNALYVVLLHSTNPPWQHMCDQGRKNQCFGYGGPKLAPKKGEKIIILEEICVGLEASPEAWSLKKNISNFKFYNIFVIQNLGLDPDPIGSWFSSSLNSVKLPVLLVQVAENISWPAGRISAWSGMLSAAESLAESPLLR